MSIEEKAKAYDEALERARNYYNGIGPCRAKDELEKMFPQLRESEDERIRKILIDMVKRETGFTGFPSQGQVLAWLEKQKDCILVPKSHLDPAGKPGVDGMKILEKQKEQKPAWSEEDERILKGIIGKIDHDQTYGVAKADMLSFLKRIRPSWKPSEEQQGVEPLTKLEKAVFDMLVERTHEITISEKQARKYAPIFLEIAKGGHWKPSEEQMEALMLAIEGKCPPTSYMSRRLEDLYDGLANTYRIDAKLD